MRIVQPSVAKRITFARWARHQGLRRHTSVSYYLPDDVTPPAELLVGASIDGKPAASLFDKPKRTRKPKDPDPVPDPEPAEPVVFERNTTTGTMTGTTSRFEPSEDRTKEE